jgi:8-oxo-dGTP pyrophosphatase MutT (NUDIX family)
VLLKDGHLGATYELATRTATVRELAEEAGVGVRRVPDPGTHPWLSAMFAYYDRHGLPVGTRVLAALLRRD